MNDYTLRLLIGSITRWLLTVISVGLLIDNVSSNGNAAAFGLWLAIPIGTLVWSLVQKLRTVFELDEALRLPARSSFDQLKQVID